MSTENDPNRDRDRYPSTQGVRVLVVEDQPDILQTFAQLLRICGFEVMTASDGRVALEIAAEFHPRFVLLDIGLPIWDGYEVARRLRGEAACQPMTVIAVTGYGDGESRIRSREAGFDAYLVKPAALNVLLETFTRFGWSPVDQSAGLGRSAEPGRTLPPCRSAGLASV
jgi:CheY-like chemotaxis protein